MPLALCVGMASCSDDDSVDNRTLPFEIELKVETNASYRGLSLNLFGPNIIIDWGDNSDVDIFLAENGGYTNITVEHQYPESSSIKEYTVKITGTGLSAFEIKPDPENKDVLASIVKSVDFKNCPFLSSVGLLGVEDMKSIDYNKLPALRQLILEATYFTNLDCSAKGDLKTIILKDNQLLKTVKFPSSIETISLSGNSLLTENDVNLSSYKNLQLFYLAYNDWSSVNLLSNKELVSLTMYECDMEKVDISVHNKLDYLSIEYTDVHTLILPQNGFPELTYVGLGYNKLNADMLNSVFKSLPTKKNTSNSYSIAIHQNPGAAGCDAKIAADKGWTIYGK